MTLEFIEKLRIDAMKAKDKVARYAYEAVIAEIQRQSHLENVVMDKAKIISIIKSELKKYREMPNRKVEIELLEKLLPVQLTTEDLYELHTHVCTRMQLEKLTPKQFMQGLDELNYVGQYDKGMAAKIASGK